MKMLLLNLLFLLSLSLLEIGQAQPFEKRYAILDNDWGTTGFIPLLIALNGGMEILGLVSGM